MHDSEGMVWAEAVAMNIHSHVKSELAELNIKGCMFVVYKPQIQCKVIF